jgi:hypothetical protein
MLFLSILTAAQATKISVAEMESSQSQSASAATVLAPAVQSLQAFG